MYLCTGKDPFTYDHLMLLVLITSDLGLKFLFQTLWVDTFITGPI